MFLPRASFGSPSIYLWLLHSWDHRHLLPCPHFIASNGFSLSPGSFPWLFPQAGFEPLSSQVARIVGVSHHTQLTFTLFWQDVWQTSTCGAVMESADVCSRVPGVIRHVDLCKETQLTLQRWQLPHSLHSPSPFHVPSCSVELNL
jgi:hypothetical protein